MPPGLLFHTSRQDHEWRQEGECGVGKPPAIRADTGPFCGAVPDIEPGPAHSRWCGLSSASVVTKALFTRSYEGQPLSLVDDGGVGTDMESPSF
jgi:hypothetical protein